MVHLRFIENVEPAAESRAGIIDQTSA